MSAHDMAVDEDPLVSMDTWLLAGLAFSRSAPSSSRPSRPPFQPLQFVCKCFGTSGRVVIREIHTGTEQPVAFSEELIVLCRFCSSEPFSLSPSPSVRLFLVSNCNVVFAVLVRLIRGQDSVSRLSVEHQCRSRCLNESPVVGIAVSNHRSGPSLLLTHSNGFVTWFVGGGTETSPSLVPVRVQLHPGTIPRGESVVRSLLSYSEVANLRPDSDSITEFALGSPPNRHIKFHARHPVISLSCWSDSHENHISLTSAPSTSPSSEMTISLGAILHGSYIVFARLRTSLSDPSAEGFSSSSSLSRSSFRSIRSRISTPVFTKFVPLYRYPLHRRDQISCFIVGGRDGAEMYCWRDDGTVGGGGRGATDLLLGEYPKIDLKIDIRDVEEEESVTIVDFVVVHCMDGGNHNILFSSWWE